MLLHRIHVDPRCREARRDLSDSYQLHSTLSRAFSPPDTKCPPGEILWRLEPERDSEGHPRVLIQSRSEPHWDAIGIRGWLGRVDPPIDLRERLKLGSLEEGARFRYRVRANPCVTRHGGKRLGLLRREDQEAWLERKGLQHGFAVPVAVPPGTGGVEQRQVDVRISQEQMLRGRQHGGNGIRVFSVLYDGLLTVTDPDRFRMALETGVGHGKALGLGLLSVVPAA